MLISRQVLTLCIFQIGSSDENWKSALYKLKDNIDKEGLETALKQCNEELENWKNEPVKLAVTGKSGVGKSSFINAIRLHYTVSMLFLVPPCLCCLLIYKVQISNFHHLIQSERYTESSTLGNVPKWRKK
jgi:hypothetical protein